MAGLDSLNQNEFNTRKPDTSKPERIRPKKSEQMIRSMPNNQILVHYTGRLNKTYTPKSVQLQSDAHVALKQISVAENRPMREVINEVIENYIDDMPESKKRLIMPQIRMVQQNMPNENL